MWPGSATPITLSHRWAGLLAGITPSLCQGPPTHCMPCDLHHGGVKLSLLIDHATLSLLHPLPGSDLVHLQGQRADQHLLLLLALSIQCHYKFAQTESVSRDFICANFKFAQIESVYRDFNCANFKFAQNESVYRDFNCANFKFAQKESV